MKKSTKICLLVMSCILFCIISVIAYADYSFVSYKLNNPFVNRQTAWESDDGKITFYVPEEGGGIGTMQIGDKSIDIIVGYTICGTEVSIWDASARDNGFPQNLHYETLHGIHYGKKKFVAKVDETTFFKKGQKITFYRVDNSTVNTVS